MAGTSRSPGPSCRRAARPALTSPDEPQNPEQTIPEQADPDRAEPALAEAGPVGPGRDEPELVEPGLAEPELADAGRLTTAPLHVLGAFADASNTTLLVQLTDRRPAEPRPDDADPLDTVDVADLAVYKPVRGQRLLWDFDATTLPGREVATALVDRHLGFGLVPSTVWRDDAPLGPGSLQAYVPHDPAEHWLTWVDDERRDDEAMARLVVLDLVINNTDRKSGHVLVGPRRIWAIDHGVTFHVDDKLRTVCWELQGEPVPAGLREGALRLARWLGDEPAGLRRHLSSAEVDATRRRAQDVAVLDRFPALVHRGQLPWPLV